MACDYGVDAAADFRTDRGVFAGSGGDLRRQKVEEGTERIWKHNTHCIEWHEAEASGVFYTWYLYRVMIACEPLRCIKNRRQENSVSGLSSVRDRVFMFA